MKFRILRVIVRFLVKLIADIEVHGLEKIPKGNFIGAANHLGRLDPAVMFCIIDREDIIMPVAEKYEEHPIFGYLGRIAGAIWLNRYNSDLSAMREILRRMEQGGMVVICPEGTRSPTASLMQGKVGVAYLASKGGFPVLPVAAIGTEDRAVTENLKNFRRLKIVVRIGDLMYFDFPNGKGREQAMREVTDEIMCHIGAMLPETYRGFYANHPRLKQLEAQGREAQGTEA